LFDDLNQVFVCFVSNMAFDRWSPVLFEACQRNTVFSIILSLTVFSFIHLSLSLSLSLSLALSHIYMWIEFLQHCFVARRISFLAGWAVSIKTWQTSLTEYQTTLIKVD
jgi:hypothetical protein